MFPLRTSVSLRRCVKSGNFQTDSATEGFTYRDKGLITMGVDARDNASVYSYAESGRVMSNQNGAGGGHGFGVMCHASCVTGYESSRLTFDY